MAIHIDTSIFLLLSLLSLMLIPYFHLLFICLVMSINEWLDKLVQKIGKLILSTYDVIVYIISNPIILTGLIIYLCVSIARFWTIWSSSSSACFFTSILLSTFFSLTSTWWGFNTSTIDLLSRTSSTTSLHYILFPKSKHFL